jgi:hypothetical protein
MMNAVFQANQIDAAIKSIVNDLNGYQRPYFTNSILVKVIPTENS